MIDCTERGINPHQPVIKGEITQMAKTLTPKEIALELGTSGKTLRKFLRQDEKLGSLAPGKGGRWAIPATSVKSMQKRFDAWKQAQAEEAAKRREEAASAENADDDANEEEGVEETESTESPVEDEAPEGDDEVNED